MRLLRIGMLYFDPPPSGWESFQVTIKGVKARTLAIGRAPEVKDKLRLMLVAETPLNQLPTRDVDECISVPEKERRQCEQVIEAVANTIAVTSRCRRSISSPSPPAAFVPETKGDQEFLDQCKGVRVHPIGRASVLYPIKLSDEIASTLAARHDGLALMAEAFSSSQDTGKYQNLVRLFELAFALPANGLDKKLSQYLAGANLGYTRNEVVNWLSFRDGVSHADLKKTKKIVLQADITPFIARMEQAAEDVLFNKAEWHEPSRERRNVVTPLAATTSLSGDLQIVEGSKVRLRFQLFDAFGVYPWDLNGTITVLPHEWWWKPFRDAALLPPEC